MDGHFLSGQGSYVHITRRWMEINAILIGCWFFPVDDGRFVLLVIYHSGQIIATSHDLTPNGGLVREIPLFQGNLGW